MDELVDFFSAIFEEAFQKCERIFKNQSLAYDENEPLVTPEFCSILEDMIGEEDNTTEYVTTSASVLLDNVTDETPLMPDQEPAYTVEQFFITEWIFILALFVNIVVMFAQKRKHCCKNCCWGYFGLVFPVNFLEGRRHRITILSGFVLTSAQVLAVFMQKQSVPNPFAKVFIKVALVLKTTATCAPILTCFSVDTYATLVIGIFYTLLYILLSLGIAVYNQLGDLDDLEDEDLRPEHYVSLFVSEAIVLVSGILVLYGYIRRIYRKCTSQKSIESSAHQYHRVYMRKLLSKKIDVNDIPNANANDPLLRNTEVKIQKEKPKQNKCITCWKNKVYASTPGFRYGLCILVSLTVGITALSFLITKFLARAISARYFILHVLLQQASIKKALSKIPFPNLLQAVVRKVFKTTKITTEWKITAYELIYDQLEVFLTCICVVIAFVYVVMYYTSLNILRSYKENIFSLHQRKRDSNLLKMKSMSNAKLVVAAVQYSGYQVAYLLWGAILQMVVASLILIAICEIVFLPIKYGSWKVIQVIFEWIAPIVLTMILTKGTQWLLVRFFFLQDKGTVLALDNRRGFYIMMYFMFYYNIFMGLFSCLLRIIKATVFGLYYLPRLDRSIFPKTFEHLDGGFKSYTCLMKLEAIQSNVIVTCFANTLLKKEPFDQSPGEDDEITGISYIENNHIEKNEANMAKKRKKNIARNRWHVAYTLLHNPELTFERGVQNKILEVDEDNASPQRETTI